MRQSGDRGLSRSNGGSLRLKRSLSLGLSRSRSGLDGRLLLRLGHRRVNPVSLQSTKAQAAKLHLDTSQTTDTSRKDDTLSFSLLVPLSSARIRSGTGLDTWSGLGSDRTKTRGSLISSGRFGSSRGSLFNSRTSNGRVSFPAVLLCRLRRSLFRMKLLHLFRLNRSFGRPNDSFGLGLNLLLCRGVTERFNSFSRGFFEGLGRDF